MEIHAYMFLLQRAFNGSPEASARRMLALVVLGLLAAVLAAVSMAAGAPAPADPPLVAPFRWPSSDGIG